MQLNFTEVINKGKDFSKYHKMRIYGSYTTPKKNDLLRIMLLNFDPSYSTDGKMNTYKYNMIELQSKDLGTPIEIDLSTLAVPNWWANNMKGKDVNTNVDITNIPVIEVSTGSGASYGLHKLRINRVELDTRIITLNKLYERIIIMWGILLLVFVISTIAYLIITLKKSKRSEQNLRAINDVLSVKSAELELISKHDELTGLLNRTGLKSKMVECLDKQLYPLTLVMIDVDFFKKINDTFGHQKGDKVLSTLGQLLRNFAQDEESVSRFGGEEFILLMPNKDTNDVMGRLEKLRQQIACADMDINQKVTASFGLASSHEYSEFKQLIDSADSALYRAKNDGRNCIRVNA